MKALQITMDDELVGSIDERAKRLGMTRSEFARQALRAALAHYEEVEDEERQKAGYRRVRLMPQEFVIPMGDHAWGDVPWKDG